MGRRPTSAFFRIRGSGSVVDRTGTARASTVSRTRRSGACGYPTPGSHRSNDASSYWQGSAMSEPLAIGSKAPGFKAPASDDRTYALADLLKQGAVALVFYPGNNTPG